MELKLFAIVVIGFGTAMIALANVDRSTSLQGNQSPPRRIFGSHRVLPSKSKVKVRASAPSEGFDGELAQGSVFERQSKISIAQDITKDLVYNQDYLSVSFLGFTARNEALYVINHVSSGRFLWYNTVSGRLLRTASSSAFAFDHLRLSADGKTIFTTANATPPRKKLYLNELLVIDAENLKSIATIETRPRTNIFNPCPMGENSNKVALPVLEFTWIERLKDFAGDPEQGARIELWNWKAGVRERTIRYSHAPGISNILFSPDDKYVACFFQGDTKDHFASSGILDIVDSETGKVYWHVEGNKDQPVGYPFVFLSPTQILCQDVSYNLTTKEVKLLFLPKDRRRKFVSGVPKHDGKVFILTKDGLELWNWTAQRVLRRWPKITKADQITLAPNFKVMAVETEGSFEFWKFDSTWLQ